MADNTAEQLPSLSAQSLAYFNGVARCVELIHRSHAAIIDLVCAQFGHPEKAAELKSAMLDDRVRLRRKRNPHLPKRPISAYAAYLRHARSEALEKAQDKNPREVLKELARMWKDLSEEAKQPFVQIAQKDKQRYKEAMESYTDGLQVSLDISCSMLPGNNSSARAQS